MSYLFLLFVFLNPQHPSTGRKKKLMLKLSEIPAGAKRGWVVKVNGETVDTITNADGEEVPITSLEVINEKIGLEYRYGWMPLDHENPGGAGYDMMSVRERNGGGPVTVIWAKSPFGLLAFGLIPELRFNQNVEKAVWCIPGGFAKLGETNAETQRRETKEETGLEAGEPSALPGLPMVCNRALSICNPYEGEGNIGYPLEIPWNCLEATDSVEVNGEFVGCLKLKAGIAVETKKADAMRFFFSKDLSKVCADGIALSAIERFRESLEA